MARISFCTCCGHPNARLHRGGFTVCEICKPSETEHIGEGSIREERDRVRDAKYREVAWYCSGRLCGKKTFLGRRVFVMEWK
jgi:hypothetical protein